MLESEPSSLEVASNEVGKLYLYREISMVGHLDDLLWETAGGGIGYQWRRISSNRLILATMAPIWQYRVDLGGLGGFGSCGGNSW